MDWSAMKSIAFPFRFDTFGRATVTEDLGKIYMDRLYTLLSTPAGTRPLNPNYGTNIHRAMYENADNEVEAIEAAINTAVNRWLPILTVESIEFTEPSISGEAYVNVTVSFPDATTSSVTLSTSNLLQNG